MNNTDDTEYEDDEFDGEGYQEDDTPEPEVVAEVHPEAYPRQQMLQSSNVINRTFTVRSPFFGRIVTPPQYPPPPAEAQHEVGARASTIYMPAHYRTTPDHVPTTDLVEASSRLSLHAQVSSTPTLIPPHTSRVIPTQRQHRNLADALPIVESSASPSPIDTSGHVSAAASDTGTGFFRSYNERPTNALSPLGGDGTLTPDLNFAEIGHGRGAHGAGTSATRGYNINRTPRPRPAHDRPLRLHSSVEYNLNDKIGDNSRSRTTTSGSQGTDQGPSSSVTQELHESVQIALDGEPRGRQEQGRGSSQPEPRARSVRRQIRNTIHAAEQYASTLFHRSGHPNEGGDVSTNHPSGSGSNRGPRPR